MSLAVHRYVAGVKVVASALLLFAIPLIAIAGPPAAKPFEEIRGCALEPDEWTDGDSFRVRLPDGRLETFRLYFVDTTESRSRGKRSDEQAAYFTLTRKQAIELGKEAKIFTAAALAKPFTVQTRWRQVFGPTRYYAMVYTAAGQDLVELLVKNGLARIYGTRTPLPDGTDSRTYLAHLRTVEADAKQSHRGGWRK
jgi:endonuclease YncB( thermonuclease family)